MGRPRSEAQRQHLASITSPMNGVKSVLLTQERGTWVGGDVMPVFRSKRKIVKDIVIAEKRKSPTSVRTSVSLDSFKLPLVDKESRTPLEILIEGESTP